MTIEATTTKSEPNKILTSSWLDTPVGPMLAIADEAALHLLEFGACNDLEWEVERLKKITASTVISGFTKPIGSIKFELVQYFNGNLREFRTPVVLHGSLFQQTVWKALLKIPHGKTCSYAELAASIHKPTAFRAVANANGANQLAIIIPCHRVINTNGKIGGYGGGVARKEWLLNHEKLEPR